MISDYKRGAVAALKRNPVNTTLTARYFESRKVGYAINTCDLCISFHEWIVKLPYLDVRFTSMT